MKKIEEQKTLAEMIYDASYGDWETYYHDAAALAVKTNSTAYSTIFIFEDGSRIERTVH
jgi:hypothetical protein